MSSRIINSTPPDSTVIKSGSDDDNRPLYLANDEGICVGKSVFLWGESVKIRAVACVPCGDFGCWKGEIGPAPTESGVGIAHGGPFWGKGDLEKGLGLVTWVRSSEDVSPATAPPRHCRRRRVRGSLCLGARVTTPILGRGHPPSHKRCSPSGNLFAVLRLVA